MTKKKLNFREAHCLHPGEKYALLPARVLKSQAFHSLCGSAVRLLMLALTRYNGSNNGDISLTHASMMPYGFTSADTHNRALQKLLQSGLLIKTRQGYFSMGGKHPSLYGFAWLPIPANRKLEIDTPREPEMEWPTIAESKASNEQQEKHNSD